jgi:tetratricopeptide (TPR) repeat protein
MRLGFDVLDREAGVFVYPEQPFNELIDAFDDLLALHEDRALSDSAYAKELQALIDLAPDMIDAHAHLAFHWYRLGKPRKALDAALGGLRIANRLIPEGFTGRIEWGHLENRPYLRALQGAALACMRLRRHTESVALIERMLACNPNDNQGVRYLLGSEALRAGDAAKARAVIEQEGASYPPYLYELGLVYLLAGEWAGAATALRRGFFLNPYIAEMLNGNPAPRRMPVWHGSSHEDPDEAASYLEMHGRLWEKFPDLKLFVRWLFDHPQILVERGAVMACRYELQWENDQAARSRLFDRMQHLYTAIDEKLSTEITSKRIDRYGEEYHPWMLALRVPSSSLRG